MAASSFVPSPSRAPSSRALASAAAARTAPRGPGLARVVPLPLPGEPAVEQGRQAAGAVPPVALPGSAQGRTPVLRAVPASPQARRARLTLVLAAAAAAAVLTLAVSGLIGAVPADGQQAVAGHVVLQPGETLWDVAVRSAPAGVDPRKQLDDIRRVNGFGPGAHAAWTVVLIPAR